MAENNILGGAATQGPHDAGTQLGFAHQHLFLVWGKPGESLGLPPGHEGDLLNRVMGFHQGSHQGVTHLVISDQALAASIGERLAFHAGNHPVHGIIDFGQGGGFLATASRKDGCFVEQVGKVGAGEAWRATRDRFEAHVRSQFLIADVNFEDGEPALDIGGIHLHLAIEAAGPHQGRIEHVGSIRGRNDDDATVSLEAVHLGEQLIKGLLPFVIAAADTGTALPADGIDFIDKDQAGTVFLGPFEKIPHPACANTHEHLHEFGTRKREERHARLASDRFGEKCFAGAGGAYQQHTFGNFCPHRGKALGGLQKGHHLLQILLGLLNAGHVIELHSGFGLHREAGFGFAELHRLAGPTGHAVGAAREKYERADQQQGKQEIAEQSEGRGGRLGGVNVEADALLLELVHQLRGQARQVDPQPLHPVVEVGIHRLNHGRAAAIEDVHCGHATRLHVVEEAAVAHPGHRGIAWSNYGIGRSVGLGPGSEHLPSEKQGNGNRQKPEGQKTPALIHGAQNFEQL